MTDLTTSPLTPPEVARVHATAWAILGDPHSADDVVQDLALRLQDGPDEGEPRERAAWMARTALGLSLNRRRGDARRNLHEREAGLRFAKRWVEPPERPLERAEDLDLVRRAVADLDELLRLPLILRYFHDRRLSEVASLLAIPVSTAHERMQRGLARLRGRLRRVDVAPALIGLTLPRTGAAILPAAAIGRASMVVGGGIGLVRAAALLATLSLVPLVPRLGAEGLDDDVARAPAAPSPVVFVTPPGPMLPPDIDPGSEALPPTIEEPTGLEPPAESDHRTPGSGEPADEPAPGPAGHAERATGSAIGDGAGVAPWTPPAPGAGERATRPATGSETRAESEDPDTETWDNQGADGDGPPPPPSFDSNGGSTDSGDDDGPGEPPLGLAFGAGNAGGALIGHVSEHGTAQALGGVWVVLFPLVGQHEDPAAAPPPIAAATDDEGRFELRVPAGPGEWGLGVGIPNGAGGLDELPIGAARLDGGLWLELDLD